MQQPNINEDDPKKIETKSYEFYLNWISDDIRQRCELDEMYAYQMTGDAETVQEGNEVCPSNGQQCCGKEDVERIKYVWGRDRHR